MRPKRERLTSLDGIRGLSMILVFLNHISPVFAAPLIPPFLQLLGTSIFASGVLGVSFLFILTGFLMAYIYPNPSQKINFLQKRYTRIFPLFLTMSIIMLILRNYPKFAFLSTIPLIVILALIGHSFWVYVIKRINNKIISWAIFISFLILQISIGLLYSLIIIRFPPVVFNQQLPIFLREGMIGLVNSTLTLPLGNYVPMLDGVYWSLTSEILFYIIYPLICIPFILYLSGKNIKIKLLFLASLLPLFAGADVLSHKILVISMLQLSLFYYFVVGMVLGILYRNKSYLFEKFNLKYTSLIFLVLSIILIQYLNHTVSSYLYPWINLLWSFPFGIVVFLAISKKTYLSKFLSNRFLVFIGLISYSIYLSHTAVIHMMENLFKPSSTFSNLSFILISFLVTVAISSFLYFLLERPYFFRSKKKENIIPMGMKTSPAKINKLLIGICFLYVVSIFFAFQSDFNFFSIETPFNNVIISPKLNNSSKISMHTFPTILMQINSTDSGLGVITMHIVHNKINNFKGNLNSQLIFKIKQKGDKNWYSISGYDLYRIDNSIHHPFGFPQIQDSKNKTYLVELSLSDPKGSDYIVLDTSKDSIKGIYPIGKLELLKNPFRFGSFILTKVITIIDDNQARYAFLLFLPFFSIATYLIITDRNLSKRGISSV